MRLGSCLCRRSFRGAQRANPESRGSGFGPSDRPGTTVRKSHRSPERVGEIDPFPGETAILVDRAAEMAVSGGAAIDRTIEFERAPNVGWRQAEHFRQDLLELFL